MQALLDGEIEAHACSLAEVKGEKGGKRIIRTVYVMLNIREIIKKWGTMWAIVAVPASLTATMLAKGETKTKGFVPPEGLEPGPFLTKLAEKGMVYQERITREIRL